MFDSVLRRDTLPKRRFGSGAVIAAVVFAGAAAFTAWAQARNAAADKKEVAVTFVKPPPPPPPPPPAPTQVQPKPKKLEKPTTVLQQAIVAPTVVPQEKPPEQEPVEQAATGEPGGELGGEVGGVVGGIKGGVVVSQEAPPPRAPVEFDPGRMDPPKLLGGPNPQYTEKALEREVQGTMVVKCVVSVEGRVTACRVLRSLPYMDRAVIDALERRQYSPATLGGKPIEVDYTFKLTLKLPD